MMNTKTEIMNEHDFDIAITMYADHLKASYVRFWGDRAADVHVQRMIVERSISFERGRNYLRVVNSDGTSRSVHSFIVIKPTKGFKFGDILKAACWAAPATNFSRGNVFDTNSYQNIGWAGI